MHGTQPSKALHVLTGVRPQAIYLILINKNCLKFHTALNYIHRAGTFHNKRKKSGVKLKNYKCLKKYFFLITVQLLLLDAVLGLFMKVVTIKAVVNVCIHLTNKIAILDSTRPES
jgi:hypothetical protein